MISLRRALLPALLVSACGSAAPPALDATVTDTADDTATHSHDAAVDARDAPAVDAPSRCANGVGLPYPTGPATVDEGMPLADVRFATESGSVAFSDWYTPCARTPTLLVIRTLAAWSGPSQYAAAHTSRLFAHPQASRLAVLDLLALSADNTPARAADLAAWRARYDAPPTALAADPEYRFRTLYFGAGELPLYAMVDPRTMRVIQVVTRPSAASLTHAITTALAQLDGLPRPPAPPSEPRIDGRFTADEWEQLRAMALPLRPQPDPTNRVADDTRAAALGELLFRDFGLSSTGTVSCQSCHAPAFAFTDQRPRGRGLDTGDRNTPTVFFAPFARWSFLDGRADSAWAQALGPIENPLEMGSARTAVAHRIRARYGEAYTALFGPLPALEESARFPVDARPGTASWDAMRAEDRTAINALYANVGRAIAAYERTLVPPPTAFDRYVMGDTNALTVEQRDGLHHFMTVGCIECHHGPMLSDDSFHNIGMPTGRRDGLPDRGRADAVMALESTEFRGDGPYSDGHSSAAAGADLDAARMQVGHFHTPTLRSIARTGPWGHGGTFTTLNDVVRHYARGLTSPPVEGTTGTRDLHLPAFHLDDGTVVPIVRLLEAL